MPPRIIRMLFVPRERFPHNRVRINVLFGNELLARGHCIDLVMQAAHAGVRVGQQSWCGRSVFVGPTDDGDGFVHRLRKHWLGLRHDLRSLRLLKRGGYDALLVSDKILFAALAAPLTRRRGLKFIFWLTFPFPEIELLAAREGTARYPWLARLRGEVSAWLLYNWILRRSDYVFVQSERMKENICAHGISPDRVSPIVTGFGLREIEPIRPRAAAGAGEPPVLAYLGTLSADRHLEILVDMLAYLRAAGMPARLLLIGDADRSRDRELLESRAREQGVAGQLEITGLLPHAQALKRIAEADVCLSPIHRSPVFDVGSPTKMIEYMALGMPIVANDHPEQAQILRESRAGVCVPWQARHFARAVRWLMARSPAQRAEMGARGRAWVEANRTYARIADEVESTCIRVLRGSPTYELNTV